jgi:membrane protein implicated in regulation of membrane protease activity
MTISERAVLLLLALPFSTALAVAVYWLLKAPAGYRLAAALLVFIASELVLHRLASRIRSPVGSDSLPGREVEVLADFEPDERGYHAGHVRLDGVRWRARAAFPEEIVLRKGMRARIVRVDGLTLWVSPLSREAREDQA